MKLSEQELKITKNDFEKLLMAAGILYINPGSKAIIWRPYGISIINQFAAYVRNQFRKFEYEEYIFPFLANSENFNLLNDKIYKFEKGVFKIDDVVLRPSGEIVIYPIFKNLIKNINDLPLKVFQIGSMFRKGRQAGIFRTNEVDFFIEAHSAHASPQEVEKQVIDNNSIIESVLSYFGLYTIKSERPIWTNKPVAERSYGYDAILPTGETALAASNYAQMQIFSRVFNVGFIDSNSNYDNTYQSTLGFSFRPLLFSLWQLSDERGVRLLPSVAPIKVAIVEINPHENPKITQYVKQIKDKLSGTGISFSHDSDFRLLLSKRFSRAEIKGIPLRIEVGLKEADDLSITIKRRDNSESVNFEIQYLEKRITALLQQMEEVMRKEMLDRFNNSIIKASCTDDIIKNLENGKVCFFNICSLPDCINGLQKNIGRGEVLGIVNNAQVDVCIYCGERSTSRGYYSRRI